MIVKGGVCLFGEVVSSPSKSVYIRKSICDYLSGCYQKNGDNGLIGEDFAVIDRALDEIGRWDKLNRLNIFCGESATVFRVLSCVLAAIGGSFKLSGRSSLLKRPLFDLAHALDGHGVRVGLKEDGIYLDGRLVPGDYTVDVKRSSQVCTGLLMALCLLDGDSRVFFDGELKSRPYVDMTVNILKAYGVRVERTKEGYFVPGGQKYKHTSLTVDGDWSNGASLLVGAAISGKVTVNGLSYNTLQGDRIIADLLDGVGARVTLCGGKNPSVTVEKCDLKPFDFNVDNCPDLGPMLAVLGAYIEGESRISGIKRLVYKESDRLLEITRLLSGFSVPWRLDGDSIIISGGHVKGGTCLDFRDHRMVEAAVIMAGASDLGATITGEESVKKAYAGFFEDYKKLGGKFS